MMRIGIFAKTFAVQGASASLQSVRGAGFEVAHFNMAILGGAAMPDAVSAQDCAQIAAASRSSGVPIAAVSATYNMIHPDPAMRADGMARLAVLIRAAPLMGTRLVTLCTGTRHATDQWAYHRDNASSAAWRDLVEEMAKAVALAEQHEVDLGIEPELANVVASAALAHDLVRVVGSPRIRIILDPANLFEKATISEARDIVRHATDLLGDRIAMAHAKDRRADGSFASAGSGIVDFPAFVSALRAVGFDGPLVTHGLSEAEAPGVAAFLHRVVAGNGAT